MTNFYIHIVLCEGPHDAEFLYKILRTDGFRTYNNIPLHEMPSLLKDHIIAAYKNYIEIKEGQEIPQHNWVQRPKLPYLILQKTIEEKTVYFVIYPLGGNRQNEKANDLLLGFQDTFDAYQAYEETYQISISIFLDADDKTVEEEVVILKNNFRALITEVDNIAHNIHVPTATFKTIGCYIFADNTTSSGKLENIILPLMKADNEPIFNDAQTYIDTHYHRNNLRRRGDFDNDKSLIGIAGQLQLSGRPNTAIIKDSNYITPAKIAGDATCQEILAFFNTAIQALIN